MATSSPSTALVPASPIFSNAERLALAGFLAGCSGLTRQAYELDLRQYANCATSTTSACSVPDARTLNAVLVTWKRLAGHGPPSPGDCPPSLGSTATPLKKNSSITHRPLTYAVRASTTNPTPSA
jgi:hypothetical protein